MNETLRTQVREQFHRDSLDYTKSLSALAKSAPEEACTRIWAHMRAGNLLLATMLRNGEHHEELLAQAFRNMIQEAREIRAAKGG